MQTLKFSDFELIQKSLVSYLKSYTGDINSKNTPDEVYLKILSIMAEIKSDCSKHCIDSGLANSLEISLSYNLEQLENSQVEKQNLLLDF